MNMVQGIEDRLTPTLLHSKRRSLKIPVKSFAQLQSVIMPATLMRNLLDDPYSA